MKINKTGLPYIGSKKAIADKIVNIIGNTDKTIYDIFGGGGAITCELAYNGNTVVYNDKDTASYNVVKMVLNDDINYKSLIVPRDEFIRIKELTERTTKEELVLVVNSFGCDRKSYAFSKVNSEERYNAMIDFVNKFNRFDKYGKYFKEKTGLPSSKYRLPQFGRIMQLIKMGKIPSENIEFYNKDYTYFKNVKDSVFYLDPPYFNTTDLYRESIIKNELIEFCDTLTKNGNKVFISEYEPFSDRMKIVAEFDGRGSTLNSGKSNNKKEKLFEFK